MLLGRLVRWSAQSLSLSRYDTLLYEPGGEKFWTRHGQYGVHEAFRIAVDDVLASDKTSYQMF